MKHDEICHADDDILTDYYDGDAGLGRALHKSDRTIARWRALGEGPPVTKIGKSILYHREAVRTWLRARCVSDG